MDDNKPMAIAERREIFSNMASRTLNNLVRIMQRDAPMAMALCPLEPLRKIASQTDVESVTLCDAIAEAMDAIGVSEDPLIEAITLRSVVFSQLARTYWKDNDEN